MSQAKKKTDAERTAIMLDLVHRSYVPDWNDRQRPISHVVVEEVAPGTGWGSSRYADVLALSVWPSDGLKLHGFEIKASRADLKRELADPSKHHAVARYCDTWTLVLWNEALYDGLQIPAEWGIQVVTGDDDDALTVIRKSPKLIPDPWSREFCCSLVRNAFQQSPGAAYVARACKTARNDGLNDGQQAAEQEKRAELRLLARALGIDEWEQGERIIEAAIARLAK